MTNRKATITSPSRSLKRVGRVAPALPSLRPRTSPISENPGPVDFASEFELPMTVLEDLVAIAVDEIGNGSGRALSVLLAASKYVDELKALRKRMLGLAGSP